MQFGLPQCLWLLLLVPALAAFFWWSGRVRQRLMTRFIQSRLLPGLLAGYSPRRQKLGSALLLGAVALLALVLARPRWGFHLEEVKQRGLDVVVALDTSRSMLANDVAPNRLERAKLEALALAQLCKADRLGLVAFAGNAFLQSPLSLDEEAFRQGLEVLDVGIIPQGGTALAEAIRTALGAFKAKTDDHRVLVLFSDGEDHDGQAVEAAQEAARQGVVIFTIGVGTPNGELLSYVDDQGRRAFVKDAKDQVVKSSLNEPLLREIASAAKGFYLPLAGAKTMDTLYQRGLAPLPRTESESRTIRQYHERFQWFLAPAIVLLLAEMFLAGMAKNGRLRPPGSKARAAAALLALLMLPHLAPAASPGRALREYRRGNYSRALTEYEKLSERKPDDARLHYNTGAAAYQEKEYEQALKQFSAGLATPDVKLQEQAYYNLGNTRYRLGEDAADPKQQMAQWQQAVSSYESALKLDPKDEDSRHNLELVKKRLEELKQQQQQKKPDDKQQDKDQDKNQDKNQQEKNQRTSPSRIKTQQDKEDQNKQDQQKQDQQKQSQGDQQKKEDQAQNQPQDQRQQQKQEQSQPQEQDWPTQPQDPPRTNRRGRPGSGRRHALARSCR